MNVLENKKSQLRSLLESWFHFVNESFGYMLARVVLNDSSVAISLSKGDTYLFVYSEEGKRVKLYKNEDLVEDLEFNSLEDVASYIIEKTGYLLK
ncbi:MAG: hypothetical protein ACP5KF_06500 [Sulfurihydrogenibium sp.]